MKATGVIRRIDDLGRIVVPKEIRKSLKINDGDSLEIYVDNNKIILTKYSIIDNISFISKKIVDSYYKIFNKNIIITDKEKIIACSKNIKEYENGNITSELKQLLISREEVLLNHQNIIITGIKENFFFKPIIVDSDVVGSIILIDNDISNYDKDIIRLISTFLIKNIEE